MLAACAPSAPEAAADPGHDHGGELGWTDFAPRTMIYVAYAPPVSGREAHYLAHLTDLETGYPVEAGELVYGFTAGGQLVQESRGAVGEAPGFVSVRTPLPGGEYSVSIQLRQAEGTQDFGPFSLRVHGDAAAADAALHAAEDEADPESVAFSVEQQWTIGLRSQPVARRDLARRVAVPASFETPHDAQAIVAAPFAGRVLAPEGSALPKLGDTVTANAVLGTLEASLGAGDLAAWRANRFAWHEHEHELTLREFDLSAQKLAAEQQRNDAQLTSEFARAQLERVEGLHRRQLATDVERDQARQALAAAELKQRAAEDLLSTLETIGERLEELRREHGEESDVVAAPRHELQAPLAGVIEAIEVVAGQQVEAGSPLYRVVDPNRLWLTLQVPEHDLPAFDRLAGAQLRVEAHGPQLLDLHDDLQARLVLQARELDPESRTLAVRYAVQDPQARFRPGMFADVLLATGAVEQALAIPATAVVQQDGLPVAFVQTAGESFSRRVLDLGVRDGDWIEVRRGLAEGERVVVDGAYPVRLAASAPDSFGHGHVH